MARISSVGGLFQSHRNRAASSTSGVASSPELHHPPATLPRQSSSKVLKHRKKRSSFNSGPCNNLSKSTSSVSTDCVSSPSASKLMPSACNKNDFDTSQCSSLCHPPASVPHQSTSKVLNSKRKRSSCNSGSYVSFSQSASVVTPYLISQSVTTEMQTACHKHDFKAPKGASLCRRIRVKRLRSLSNGKSWLSEIIAPNTDITEQLRCPVTKRVLAVRRVHFANKCINKFTDSKSDVLEQTDATSISSRVSSPVKCAELVDCDNSCTPRLQVLVCRSCADVQKLSIANPENLSDCCVRSKSLTNIINDGISKQDIDNNHAHLQTQSPTPNGCYTALTDKVQSHESKHLETTCSLNVTLNTSENDLVKTVSEPICSVKDSVMKSGCMSERNDKDKVHSQYTGRTGAFSFLESIVKLKSPSKVSSPQRMQQDGLSPKRNTVWHSPQSRSLRQSPRIAAIRSHTKWLSDEFCQEDCLALLMPLAHSALVEFEDHATCDIGISDRSKNNLSEFLSFFDSLELMPTSPATADALPFTAAISSSASSVGLGKYLNSTNIEPSIIDAKDESALFNYLCANKPEQFVDDMPNKSAQIKLLPEKTTCYTNSLPCSPSTVCCSFVTSVAEGARKRPKLHSGHFSGSAMALDLSDEVDEHGGSCRIGSSTGASLASGDCLSIGGEESFEPDYDFDEERISDLLGDREHQELTAADIHCSSVGALAMEASDSDVLGAVCGFSSAGTNADLGAENLSEPLQSGSAAASENLLQPGVFADTRRVNAPLSISENKNVVEFAPKKIIKIVKPGASLVSLPNPARKRRAWRASGSEPVSAASSNRMCLKRPVSSSCTLSTSVQLSVPEQGPLTSLITSTVDSSAVIVSSSAGQSKSSAVQKLHLDIVTPMDTRTPVCLEDEILEGESSPVEEQFWLVPTDSAPEAPVQSCVAENRDVADVEPLVPRDRREPSVSSRSSWTEHFVLPADLDYENDFASEAGAAVPAQIDTYADTGDTVNSQQNKNLYQNAERMQNLSGSAYLFSFKKQPRQPAFDELSRQSVRRAKNCLIAASRKNSGYAGRTQCIANRPVGVGTGNRQLDSTIRLIASYGEHRNWKVIGDFILKQRTEPPRWNQACRDTLARAFSASGVSNSHVNFQQFVRVITTQFNSDSDVKYCLGYAGIALLQYCKAERCDQPAFVVLTTLLNWKVPFHMVPFCKPSDVVKMAVELCSRLSRYSTVEYLLNVLKFFCHCEPLTRQLCLNAVMAAITMDLSKRDMDTGILCSLGVSVMTEIMVNWERNGATCPEILNMFDVPAMSHLFAQFCIKKKHFDVLERLSKLQLQHSTKFCWVSSLLHAALLALLARNDSIRRRDAAPRFSRVLMELVAMASEKGIYPPFSAIKPSDAQSGRVVIWSFMNRAEIFIVLCRYMVAALRILRQSADASSGCFLGFNITVEYHLPPSTQDEKLHANTSRVEFTVSQCVMRLGCVLRDEIQHVTRSYPVKDTEFRVYFSDLEMAVSALPVEHVEQLASEHVEALPANLCGSSSTVGLGQSFPRERAPINELKSDQIGPAKIVSPQHKTATATTVPKPLTFTAVPPITRKRMAEPVSEPMPQRPRKVLLETPTTTVSSAVAVKSPTQFMAGVHDQMPEGVQGCTVPGRRYSMPPPVSTVASTSPHTFFRSHSPAVTKSSELQHSVTPASPGDNCLHNSSPPCIQRIMSSSPNNIRQSSPSAVTAPFFSNLHGNPRQMTPTDTHTMPSNITGNYNPRQMTPTDTHTTPSNITGNYRPMVPPDVHLPSLMDCFRKPAPPRNVHGVKPLMPPPDLPHSRSFVSSLQRHQRHPTQTMSRPPPPLDASMSTVRPAASFHPRTGTVPPVQNKCEPTSPEWVAPNTQASQPPSQGRFGATAMHRGMWSSNSPSNTFPRPPGLSYRQPPPNRVPSPMNRARMASVPTPPAPNRFAAPQPPRPPVQSAPPSSGVYGLIEREVLHRLQEVVVDPASLDIALPTYASILADTFYEQQRGQSSDGTVLLSDSTLADLVSYVDRNVERRKMRTEVGAAVQ